MAAFSIFHHLPQNLNILSFPFFSFSFPNLIQSYGQAHFGEGLCLNWATSHNAGATFVTSLNTTACTHRPRALGGSGGHREAGTSLVGSLAEAPCLVSAHVIVSLLTHALTLTATGWGLQPLFVLAPPLPLLFLLTLGLNLRFRFVPG